MKLVMIILVFILLGISNYLFFTKDRLIIGSEIMFNKGIKKAFYTGWLTGANQMRDFGNCNVSDDTLFIMLKKDTIDFNYLMDSNK